MQWWTIFEAGDTMKDRPPEYSDDTTDGADGYFEIPQKQGDDDERDSWVKRHIDCILIMFPEHDRGHHSGSLGVR